MKQPKIGMKVLFRAGEDQNQPLQEAIIVFMKNKEIVNLATLHPNGESRLCNGVHYDQNASKPYSWKFI